MKIFYEIPAADKLPRNGRLLPREILDVDNVKNARMQRNCQVLGT